MFALAAAGGGFSQIRRSPLFTEWGTMKACDLKEPAMTTYTVGLKLGTRTTAHTIDAEDALVAALKSKLENPAALITYVRKSNQRGDRRHPHQTIRKTA